MKYDLIIVGAGIAGLYTSYLYAQHHPRARILILESDTQIGGRIALGQFADIDVISGAGIGRNEDYRLKELLDDLKISYSKFPVKPRYAPSVDHKCDIMSMVNHLRDIYHQSPEKYHGINFKEYARLVLGNENYQRLVTCTGYTDFQLGGILDILYDYKFEEDSYVWTGLRIDWKLLLTRISAHLGSDTTVKVASLVRAIRSMDNGYLVQTMDDNIYETAKLVLATPVNTLRQLLPDRNIYLYIHGQPFLRLYAQVDDKSNQILKERLPGLVIMKSPLQKIIPYDTSRGIYMISYSDNQYAQHVYQLRDHPDQLARMLEDALRLDHGSVKIQQLKAFYWKIGTHYYDPLDGFETRDEFIHNAQRPSPDLYVVGESVSRNQGWVEGALESVTRIVNELII